MLENQGDRVWLEERALCSAGTQVLVDEERDVVDGFERSGDHARAADFYRQALAFVTDPSRRGDYEGIEFYEEMVKREETLAGER